MATSAKSTKSKDETVTKSEKNIFRLTSYKWSKEVCEQAFRHPALSKAFEAAYPKLLEMGPNVKDAKTITEKKRRHYAEEMQCLKEVSELIKPPNLALEDKEPEDFEADTPASKSFCS